MKKLLIIKADVNDADYITSMNYITEEELAIILPVIEAIKAYDEDKSIKTQKYNWWTRNTDDWDRKNGVKRYTDLYKDKFSEEALDYFCGYLPSMDNEDIHTIESVQVIDVQNVTDLL